MANLKRAASAGLGVEAAYLDLVVEMICRSDDRKGFASGEIITVWTKIPPLP